MPLKLVLQRASTDCGLACVAMVARRSYRDVKNMAIEDLGYPPSGPYSTSIAKLRRLLHLCGIRASGMRRFRGFHCVGDVAILLVNYDPPRTTGHWIVFERRLSAPPRVLNPGWWLQHPIHTQLGRLNVSHYVKLDY